VYKGIPVAIKQLSHLEEENAPDPYQHMLEFKTEANLMS
jgi:hypothetical protein